MIRRVSISPLRFALSERAPRIRSQETYDVDLEASTPGCGRLPLSTVRTFAQVDFETLPFCECLRVAIYGSGQTRVLFMAGRDTLFGTVSSF
jgi:hypothetical protein